MNRTPFKVSALCGLLHFVSCVAPATSSEIHVEVTIDGCEGVSDARVSDFLKIELQNTVDTSLKTSVFKLDVKCLDDAIGITVWDPVTGKELRRSINAESVLDGDKERVVALAGNQLFVASWMELLAPSLDRSTISEDKGEVTAAQIAVEKQVFRASPWVLGAGMGVNFRAITTPIIMGQFASFLGRRFDTGLMVSAKAAGEFGRTEQSIGNIWGYAWHLGIEVGYWRSLTARTVFRISGGVFGVFALLKGFPDDEAISQGKVGGFSGEGAAELGVSREFGDIGIGLNVRGGYMIKNPEGKVVNQSSITLGGPFVGTAVQITYRRIPRGNE